MSSTSIRVVPSSSSAPPLSLYQPPDDEPDSPNDGEPSADLTLEELFERHLLGDHYLHARPRQIAQTRESLRLWRSATGNPPLRDITRKLANQFPAYLMERPGRSGERLASNTVLKHCTAIQRVLNLAGPPRRKLESALGLIAEPPHISKPPQVIDDVEDVFSLAEIGRLLAACGAAAAGARKGPPRAWWEALHAVAYNTALRKQTLLALRWEWLFEDDLGWWMRCPRGALKKGRAFDVFLNAAALEGLNWLGSAREGLVFPHAISDNHLHRLQQRICAAAGLPANRRFGFHALRKACANEIERISPLAVPYVLGHGGRNVTRDHYLQRRRIVAAALRDLPQPQWERPQARQRWLFD